MIIYTFGLIRIKERRERSAVASDSAKRVSSESDDKTEADSCWRERAHVPARLTALAGLFRWVWIGLRPGGGVRCADLYLPWEDPSSMSALSTLVFTLVQF